MKKKTTPVSSKTLWPQEVGEKITIAMVDDKQSTTEIYLQTSNSVTYFQQIAKNPELKCSLRIPQISKPVGASQLSS